MGYVEMLAGAKPHADFVAIPEAYVAKVPSSITMAEAATLPMSGLTALAAVRDVAEVREVRRCWSPVRRAAWACLRCSWQPCKGPR